MIQPKNPTTTVVLALLLILTLGCADTPTEPELTEDDIRQIIAEELAKTQEAKEDSLNPQEIAEIALKSTVYLRVKTQTATYYGSGFVGEGLIATCEHVLEGMTSGTVESVLNETKYPITTILAVSEKHDLAIIEVKGFTAPALPLGDSDTVQVGETVYVAGNPKKWKGSFSIGFVNAIRPEGNEFISGKILHISAPVSLGSSGGPVMNNRGEVVAILGGQEFDTQNLNFAVSVNHLKVLLATID